MSYRKLQSPLTNMPLYVCLSRLPHRCLTGAAHEQRHRPGVWTKASNPQVVQRPDERVTQLMELEHEATGQVGDLRSRAINGRCILQLVQSSTECIELRSGRARAISTLSKLTRQQVDRRLLSATCSACPVACSRKSSRKCLWETKSGLLALTGRMLKVRFAALQASCMSDWPDCEIQ